jgi:hypothetical protein
VGLRGGCVRLPIHFLNEVVADGACFCSPVVAETSLGLVEIVFRELYRKLFKRNKRLFNPLRGSHKVGEALQNAGSGDWENISVPSVRAQAGNQGRDYQRALLLL